MLTKMINCLICGLRYRRYMIFQLFRPTHGWRHSSIWKTTWIHWNHQKERKSGLLWRDIMVRYRTVWLPASIYPVWNSYCSKQKDILLIICGSAASWIIGKVINSRGGLHNRLTQTIRLEAFDLQETNEYLRYRKVKLSEKILPNCICAWVAFHIISN